MQKKRSGALFFCAGLWLNQELSLLIFCLSGSVTTNVLPLPGRLFALAFAAASGHDRKSNTDQQGSHPHTHE